MNKQLAKKFIKSQLKPLNIIVFFLVLGLILSLLFYLVLHNFSQAGKKTPAEKKEDMIKIISNDNEVTINKNGMVTVKTPTKVFNQKWDEDKTKDLFKSIEQKAKPAGQCDSVFGREIEIVYIENNETKILCVEEIDEEILLFLEMINNIDASDQSLSNLFKNYTFSLPPSPSPSLSPSPSPSFPASRENGGASDDESSPSPNSASQPDDDWNDCPFWRVGFCVWPRGWASGGTSPGPSPSLPSPLPSLPPLQPGRQDEPDCSLWDQLISGKTVVSNTLCIKEEE